MVRQRCRSSIDPRPPPRYSPQPRVHLLSASLRYRFTHVHGERSSSLAGASRNAVLPWLRSLKRISADPGIDRAARKHQVSYDWSARASCIRESASSTSTMRPRNPSDGPSRLLPGPAQHLRCWKSRGGCQIKKVSSHHCDHLLRGSQSHALITSPSFSSSSVPKYESQSIKCSTRISQRLTKTPIWLVQTQNSRNSSSITTECSDLADAAMVLDECGNVYTVEGGTRAPGSSPIQRNHIKHPFKQPLIAQPDTLRRYLVVS